ncbi:phage portal protein [Blastococcus sp. TF02A-26]|uniref:phage portal protein n=1 Tax=Blastococcus sp. TF02A-26 TaxID=2250577 RepID=UPI000DE8ADFB|nr:phage portal protein [Blastococcus sp. TF02A-26]RBY82677.1 phage portal protein [Blastococcus sp. TF02A-26]
MGLFSGARAQQRSADVPASMLEALAAGRGRGAGGSPVPVGWSGSQAIPAALDAVRLRHDLLATLPVQVFRRGKNGHPEQIEPPAVLQKPAARWELIPWLAATQKSLDLRGNGYGIVVDRDARGRATQIELQHPDTVRPVITKAGELMYRVAGHGKLFEPREIWHETCNEEPGEVPIGLSPIAACARSLGINIAAEQFGADFFRDGAHPTALISNTKASTIDQTTAAVVKARFMAAVNGSREPVVLGGDWKFDQLSVAPNESQFLETMRFGVNQTARIFNVPAELIGGGADGSSLTYANRVDRALDFLTYRFGPTIVRRENALNRLVGPGEWVKFNRGALLATDMLTRLKAYEIGLRNGVYAFDEPRELEEKPPLTPAEITALKDAGLLGKSSPAPTPSTEN